jgi:hypothetical protein
MLEKRKEKRCHVWHVLTCPTTSSKRFWGPMEPHVHGPKSRPVLQSSELPWLRKKAVARFLPIGGSPVDPGSCSSCSMSIWSIRFYHIPLILCYIPSSILWYFLEHSFELCFAGQVVPLGFICWHWKIHRCQGEIVKSGSMQPPCFPKTELGGELGGAKFRRRADEVIPKGSKTELPLLL